MENEYEPEVQIEVRDIYKVFGSKPEKGLELLKKGEKKDKILEKTGQTVGLDNVSFQVHKGEIFVLMGLSGCGKSTLLRCLNRLIEPTAGEIIIKGKDIVAMNEDEIREFRRQQVGMIFQNFALLPHKTVIDNVAFGLEIQGMALEERHKKAQDALQLVGLTGYETSMPDQLSGGMKQRVGLARALASDAEILLMDEAFSALDPLIRRDMQDELIDLQERLSKTVIFVTHDLDEALKLGNRIALMRDGKIIQVGTAEEILTNPSNEYVERFVADVDMTRVLTAQDVMKKADPVISCKSGPRLAARLMKEYGISNLFVVTQHRIIKGIVTIDDVVRAVQEDHKTLEDIVINDIQMIQTDTPLADIIPLIAESRYPIPVVDEDTRLKGIIVRGSVLSALARKESEPIVA
ncbi:MAG: glycine betaine/L-proline ABC transporter ATP-binding protein [Methanocalculus sp. MSAO_Arc1]|uniref:quaternary amine ABC transporter ATP-binding protein n=1 Tax=Methanocalculus TaxID=71151 RepID=UPI000FECFF3D|nr:MULTISPECIES: glycine betaine/L-proline ABC transporter ATP-binding protein [unclassified Methanocalculus]MCP1662074.1 glycine betaine/proline transport system ATP-binding protein [Methanocalculus sp. AMF5]RQD80136.1 MAG: glycine betaine/L-proline ABC transporter ATP-binding protein [Methanocalculus sp. MSAO_Arc1]